jgi:threonine synthase
MDIQVASNFERYLFYLFDRDPARVCAFIERFQTEGHASLGFPPADPLFVSTAVTDEDTEAAIREAFSISDYIADPHTAVGLSAARRFPELRPMICIGTAHPAKFPEVVDAVLKPGSAMHPELEKLRGRPPRRTVLPADINAVKSVIRALGH